VVKQWPKFNGSKRESNPSRCGAYKMTRKLSFFGETRKKEEKRKKRGENRKKVCNRKGSEDDQITIGKRSGKDR
jgi:hypothetical protein